MGLEFLLGFMQPDPDEGHTTVLYKKFEYVGVHDFPHVVHILSSLPDSELSELSTFHSGSNYDTRDAAFISRSDYPGMAYSEQEFVRAVKDAGVEFGLLERITDEGKDWLWTDGKSLHDVNEVPPGSSLDKYDPVDFVRSMVQMRKAAGLPLEPWLSDAIQKHVTTDPTRVRHLASMLSRAQIPAPGTLKPVKPRDTSMRRFIDDVSDGDDIR